MPILRRITSTFRTLFRAGRLERELDEELRGFVDERTRQYEARGLARDAARRAALLDVGGLEQVKEEVRDARVGRSLDTWWRDLRFGCRMIARAPGFAAAVVLTLTLAIGANATVFSVLYAVLWRELPYPAADRLVLVHAGARGVARAALADAEAADLRGHTGLFERVASIVRVNAAVAVDGEMEQVPAASVTADGLELLGAAPLLYGRALDPARDVGSDGFVRAIVISHELWERRLRGDPSAVGRRIHANNLEVEIAGVLRPDVRVLLPAGAALPEVPHVWFPRAFDADRVNRVPTTIARLAPAVPLRAARAQLDTLARRFVEDHPQDYPDGQLRLDVTPLRQALAEDVRPALWAVAGAVAAVLLIACANVANLMLARAGARLTEMRVREALGAGRARLLRQVFTETAILTALGGAGGLLAAWGGVALVEWMQPGGLPRQSEIAVDPIVVLFTAALSCGVTLALSLAAALPAGRGASLQTLGAGRADVQRRGTRRLQRLLVMAEVGLCTIALVVGVLMLQTMINLLHAPIGFQPDDVLTAKVPLSLRLLPERQQRVQLLSEAIARVAALPGVRRVSAGGPLPLDIPFLRMYGPAGHADPPSSRASVQSVFPGYFAATGVRLEAGRDFTQDDLTPGRRVAVVDRRIAQQLWPGADPLGQRLVLGDGRSPAEFDVVGVSGPVRAVHVRDATIPHVFVPYDQFGFMMALVVETDAPAGVLGPAIKREVEGLGTQRPVYDILPLRAYVERSTGGVRVLTIVLVAFAAAALALAGVGIYATLAYLTSLRRHEFAVRMALGAPASRVVGGVVGEVLLLTVTGALAGLAAALVAGAWLQEQLYEAEPFAPETLLPVACTVAAVALAATIHPALRAARADPAAVLRAE